MKKVFSNYFVNSLSFFIEDIIRVFDISDVCLCGGSSYACERNYDKKSSIIRYLSNSPFICEIHKAIGACDLELTLFTANFEHFYRIMEDLRDKFPEDITNYDYLYVTQIHKSNHLPE